ncbi:TIGR02281 family clan AA aspartic protease [Maritimibacter sp. HL-12]|jgi:aspartyl protease family protein|uniref:retropepsin-like aspartic protease family protein n=1 Tax=Maritimibacter sp. HL-12 TaxID=1162418 RepID=UPI000A0F1C5C|nr:TIGR02281 family clan AA aspartic protease [Maritimibacter sp. HL-12]SMH30930.1 aspartyl protease family protein [Maritimibacter sp. HL-12]
MDTYDIGRITYLMLLLVAVGGYFVAQHRGNLSKLAQQAAIWGLIFLGVVAGYGLWGDIQRDLAPRQVMLEGGRIEVPRMFDGHFYLTARLNGAPVEFVVDTGATDVVLTKQDAELAGIDPERLDFTGRAMTANGAVRTAQATIDEIRLGEIRDSGLRVSINEGEMPQSLLGMAYLRRFSKIEIADDMLILTR